MQLEVENTRRLEEGSDEDGKLQRRNRVEGSRQLEVKKSLEWNMWIV
jgi:hypothetical protein